MLVQKTEVTKTTIANAHLDHPREHTPVLHGFLKKRSPAFLHKWQKRYFITHPESHSMSYFKEKEESNDEHKRKGLIHVNDIKHIELKENTDFHLVCSERTYYLRAENAAERTMWVNGLRALRHSHSGHEIHTVHDDVSKNVAVDRHHNTEKHVTTQPQAAYAEEVKDAVNAKGLTEEELDDMTKKEVVQTIADTRHDLHALENTQEASHLGRQGYPIDAINRVGDDFYFVENSCVVESDIGTGREFIVIERNVGDDLRERTYNFKTPLNSEVNLKFSKASPKVEALASNAGSVPIGYPSAATTSTVGSYVAMDSTRLHEIFDKSRELDTTTTTTTSTSTKTTTFVEGNGPLLDSDVQAYAEADSRNL